MIIYQATFPNRKSYIGQTTGSLEVRQRGHKCNANTHKKRGAFYDAIRKYGFESIQWNVLLQCCTWEEMQEKEKFFIEQNKTLIPNGYNLAIGGRQPKMTESTKTKIRLAHIGKSKPPLSDEHKKAIGMASKKMWNRIGFKEQYISSGHSKRPSHKGVGGWVHSDRTKSNMSKSAIKSGTGKWMKEVWRLRKLQTN